MKKIKILCLRTSSKQASYRYRIEQFLTNWDQFNIEFDDQLIIGKSFFKRIQLIKQSVNYDYVFLHKKTLSAFFIRMIKKRSRLIFDYDDALYAIESYKKTKPKDSQPGSKTMIRRLNYILKQADLIFAGSPELKSYSEKYSQNVFLIPTALQIPAISQQKKSTNEVTIGWIGNRYNLYYLQQIDAALFRIQEEYPNVKFSIMCSKIANDTQTQWHLVKWTRETELQWLDSIDIGLMPLDDDEWSRGKCAFKLIQYMSHKKTVIASDVGANKDAVIPNKTGFLVSDLESWYKAVKQCVENKDQLSEFGENGYRRFIDLYELNKIQSNIAEILNSKLK